jgi:predicted DNA-binding transcriptional regulator YafY
MGISTEREGFLTSSFAIIQREDKAVEFIYQKADGRMSVRTVLPRGVRLSTKTGEPYLDAFDLGRHALRRYSLDKILGEPIAKLAPPEGYDPSEFEPEEFS